MVKEPKAHHKNGGPFLFSKKKKKIGKKEYFNSLPYSEYLQTKYWQKLRKRIIKERKVCEICGCLGPFHIHHKEYISRGTENKHPEVLQLLCSICHMEVHKIDTDIYEPWGGVFKPKNKPVYKQEKAFTSYWDKPQKGPFANRI